MKRRSSSPVYFSFYLLIWFSMAHLTRSLPAFNGFSLSSGASFPLHGHVIAFEVRIGHRIWLESKIKRVRSSITLKKNNNNPKEPKRWKLSNAYVRRSWRRHWICGGNRFSAETDGVVHNEGDLLGAATPKSSRYDWRRVRLHLDDPPISGRRSSTETIRWFLFPLYFSFLSLFLSFSLSLSLSLCSAPISPPLTFFSR